MDKMQVRFTSPRLTINMGGKIVANDYVITAEQLEDGFRLIVVRGSETQTVEVHSLTDEEIAAIRAAEEDRATTEQMRIIAELARVDNENIRIANERSRLATDELFESNENTRIAAENIRKENERSREVAENTRAVNETERNRVIDSVKVAESIRVSSEMTRLSNEKARYTGENERIANEAARVENEKVRKAEEAKRNANDASIRLAEANRAGAESARAANEQIRVRNEQTRQTDTAAAINRTNEAARRANEAADRVPEIIQVEDEIEISNAEPVNPAIKMWVDPSGDEPGTATGEDIVVSSADQRSIAAAIGSKVTSPDNPAVGKILKIKSVNPDGSMVCEWADAPSVGVGDVQINGTSIVSDGVANVPIGNNNTVGVLKTSPSYGTLSTTSGEIAVNPATTAHIDAKASNRLPITPETIDYGTMSALTNPKKHTWTAEQKAAACETLGAFQNPKWELIHSFDGDDSTKELIYNVDLIHMYYVITAGSNVEVPSIRVYGYNSETDTSLDNTLLYRFIGVRSSSSNVSVSIGRLLKIGNMYMFMSSGYSIDGSSASLDRVYYGGVDKIISNNNLRKLSFSIISSTSKFPTGCRIEVYGVRA